MSTLTLIETLLSFPTLTDPGTLAINHQMAPQ